MNKEGTVFQAELIALDLAANALMNMLKTRKYKYIKIFSDSMSSLQALDSGKITSKTVLKTKQSLNLLSSMVKSVRLNWIKAHVGHEGNKRADILAKEATTMIHLSEVPRAAVINKHILKGKFYELWEKSWQAEPTCHQTKQFFSKPDPLKSKKIIKLARSQLTLLLKLTTGHNALAYHASKIDPEIDSICSLCQEERETFHHFVTNCPRLRLSRQDCQLDDFKCDSWIPERLLEFARIPAIEALLDRS